MPEDPIPDRSDPCALAPQSAGAVVLSVDDLETNRYLRSRVLRSAGFKVIEAANGADALRMAAEEQPCLVVLDIRLPDIDGFEVSERLKSDPRTRAIPILHVTAAGSPEFDLPASLEHRSDAFLREPIDPEMLVATARALARRKAAENALERERELLRGIVGNIPVMLCVYDPSLRRFEVNGELERVLGWTAADAGEGGLMSLVYPDPLYRAEVAEFMRSLAPGWREFDITAKDGAVIPSEWANVRLPDGRTIGIGIDLRPRRQAEQALRDSERRYSALFANKTSAIAHCRAIAGPSGEPVDFEIVEVNEAYERVTGAARADTQGRTARRLFPGIESSPAAYIRRFCAVALEGGELNEEFFFEPLGKWLSAHVYSPRHGEFVAIFNDITERKNAERALVESEDRFRTLADNISQLAWMADASGSIFWFNRRWYEHTGTTFEQARGRGWQALVHPGHAARVIEHVERSLEAGEPWEDTFPLRMAGGEHRWFLSRALAIRDGAGRVIRWFGTNTDVTAHLEIEERLRHSEQRYRGLFESMREAFALCEVIYDADGQPRDYRYLDVNPSFEAMYGRTREEIVGRTYCELFPGPRSGYWIARLARVASTGEPAHFENYGNGPGYYDVMAYSPRPGQFAAIVVDITERKRAEEAVRESEERYRTLFTSMTEGFALGEAIYGADGQPIDFRFLEVNDAFERQSGLGREILDRPIREVLPHLEPVWIERYCRVASTGEPTHFEEYNHDTGRHYSVFSYSPARGRFAILFRDITEIRRAQDALRRSEERQSFLLSLSDTLRPLADPSEIQYQSARALGEHLGASRVGYAEVVDDGSAVAIGRHYANGVAPIPGRYRLADYGAALRQELESGRTILRPDVAGDPSLTPAENEAHTVLELGAVADVPLVKEGRLVAVLFMHRREAHAWSEEEVALLEAVAERTWAAVERAHAERALRQAVERYERQVRLFDGVASTTPDFVYLFDLEGRFLYANRRLLEVWGMQLPDVTGKTCRELGYEQWHHDMHMREIAQVIETRRPIRGEVPFKAPLTGIFGVYEYIFTPVIGPDGNVELIAGTTRDVTERKRAEEALRDRERRFRELADSVPQLVWTTDASGQVDYYNRRWREQLGVGPADSLGERWADLLHPEDRARTLEAWRASLASGGAYETEHRFRVAGGEYRWFLARANPFRDEQGRIARWIGTSTDIEDTKRSEERLRQAQKLESIGLLAGGIAHDFNNLLTGIVGNASLALEEAAPGPAGRIRDVITGAERAAHLTRQLLAYSGKGQFIVQDIDVSRAVQEMADLVEFSIPRSVDLDLKLQRRLPPVRTDPSQFQQVLMNLVINSGEAIGEGNPGRIAIATSTHDVEAPFIDALGREVSPGRYVCVAVSDTGHGIAETALPRIFDPFYTTRFTGRGMGLAATAGIVRSQNGAIMVESEPGRGSTFRVLLPAAHAHPPQPRDDRETATVLVVDDEPTVRDFIALVLRREHYRVLCAADGRDALAIFDREGGSIDAVVLDVVMPTMGAAEALPAILARRPDTRVLLTSGYSESEARRLCAAHPGAAFIQKPYTARQIAGAVKHLLGASRPGTAI